MLYGINVIIAHENLWVKLTTFHDFSVSDILSNDECLIKSKKNVIDIANNLKKRKKELNISKISIAQFDKI